MSGTYCGVRVGVYLLIVGGAVLFFVTRVMAAGGPSPVLNLEDCDWFRQSGQQAVETVTQPHNGPTGDTLWQVGLGGGGAPADQLSRVRANGARAISDEEKFWELAAASGECPARKAD